MARRSLPDLGPRGEGWFLVQLVLFGAIAAAGLAGPAWWGPVRTALGGAGIALIVAGGTLAIRGVLDLGRSLTVFPRPRPGATLVDTGAYRLARHPIYGGLILGAFGWGLAVASPLALAAAAGLMLFFDLKSRREEAWLAAQFAEYESYRGRTPRLLPWMGRTAKGERMTSQRQRDRTKARPRAGSTPAKAAATAGRGATPSRGRWGLLLGGVIGLVAVIALAVAASGMLNSGSAAPSGETVVQANRGHWTDVTADRLAAMLETKDFTLLNVKTPYIGEISGTDLYVPYDQLAARASELPASKTAKIVVYCRSGNESRIASQTLLSLGYTNIFNLAGGMEAWTSSGRSLVNLNRQS